MLAHVSPIRSNGASVVILAVLNVITCNYLRRRHLFADRSSLKVVLFWPLQFLQRYFFTRIITTVLMITQLLILAFTSFVCYFHSRYHHRCSVVAGFDDVELMKMFLSMSLFMRIGVEGRKGKGRCRKTAMLATSCILHPITIIWNIWCPRGLGAKNLGTMKPFQRRVEVAEIWLRALPSERTLVCTAAF